VGFTLTLSPKWGCDISSYFIPEDPSSRFSKLFQVIVVAHGDIFRLMVVVGRISRILAMVDDIISFHPIVIGKEFV
jgi:hypothetical protein